MAEGCTCYICSVDKQDTFGSSPTPRLLPTLISFVNMAKQVVCTSAGQSVLSGVIGSGDLTTWETQLNSLYHLLLFKQFAQMSARHHLIQMKRHGLCPEELIN